MPNFSDALQGYENGANNAVRVGAERLSIPTPVQAFLAQLQKQKEFGLQQQQVSALESYRNALAQNAGQRVENQGQHYQDMATAAAAKQALAEDKLKQALILSNRRMDIQQQIANTNQATAEGKQKVLGLQAQLQEIDLQTRDAMNDAKINFYNAGGQQRVASATKDTATTPGSGIANPKDALSIYQKSQQQADAYNRMGAGIKGFVPKVPLTMEQAKDLAAQANTGAPEPAEKDALPLQEAPGPQSQLGVQPSDLLAQPQPTMLEALLKSKKPVSKEGLPVGGIGPSGPPPPEGPYPPPPNTTPNYPVDASGLSRFNMGDPKQASMGPDGSAQVIDPLHGQLSQRAPGMYSLNGKQYLVDGSGMIQALT